METKDFDNAYAEAEGLTYACSAFWRNPWNGKAMICLLPLARASNEKSVLPLGLKVLWDNFDVVREQLRCKVKKA